MYEACERRHRGDRIAMCLNESGIRHQLGDDVDVAEMHRRLEHPALAAGLTSPFLLPWEELQQSQEISVGRSQVLRVYPLAITGDAHKRLGRGTEQRLVEKHDVLVSAHCIPRVNGGELGLRLQDRRHF